MPIYEYRCQACTKLTSFFLRSINNELEAACSHCQSKDMERRMSSFALGKTATNTGLPITTTIPVISAGEWKTLTVNSARRCRNPCGTTSTPPGPERHPKAWSCDQPES